MPKVFNDSEIISFTNNRLLGSSQQAELEKTMVDGAVEIVNFEPHRRHQYQTLPPLDEDLVADILAQLAQEYGRTASFKIYRGKTKTDFANSRHAPGEQA